MNNDDLALPTQSLSRWQRTNPAVRSAVLTWVVLTASPIIVAATGGATVALCFPLHVLVYIATGALAAYFALGSGYPVERLPRIGATAGAIGWILPALIAIIASVLGIAAWGVGILGIAAWVLCGPLSLAAQVVCGALGAWLYGRFGSSQSTP